MFPPHIPSTCWITLVSLNSGIILPLGFSKTIGVPQNHPFLDRIFPYKPSSYGGTPLYGNPHILVDRQPQGFPWGSLGFPDFAASPCSHCSEFAWHWPGAADGTDQKVATRRKQKKTQPEKNTFGWRILWFLLDVSIGHGCYKMLSTNKPNWISRRNSPGDPTCRSKPMSTQSMAPWHPTLEP